MGERLKACIIGAGSSGLAVAKTLKQNGIAYDCFEKSDCLGGNWVFKNKNGMSSAYRSLHINTSRDKMGFSDFPLPADYPDYPHHEQIARYFKAYADHFGVTPTITFKTAVTHAAPANDGRWTVKLDNGEARSYDALFVCNGHHWDPRWPEPPYPGRFDGAQFHAHHYIDETEPVDLRGKNVLIVGFGNSALDIACEIGRKTVARRCFMSLRRGYWVLPRYFGAKVLDHLNPHPAQDPPLWRRLLPKGVMAWALQKQIERISGRPEDHGLPPPEPIFATHPAISHDIYNRIGSGDVEIRKGIARFHGHEVEFVDGGREDIDAIIWCTGYKISFPFFDRDFLAAEDNDIALWQRIWDPRYPNLFFIGLVQPLCAIMPIAEQQAIVAAAYLKGEYALPPAQVMEHERRVMHARAKAGYVATPRHTIQIDCTEYAMALRRELKRGRKRAQRLRKGLVKDAAMAGAA
ncbi:MAG: flavin-containing monooxygenase [Pseudomonadota bacterium]